MKQVKICSSSHSIAILLCFVSLVLIRPKTNHLEMTLKIYILIIKKSYLNHIHILRMRNSVVYNIKQHVTSFPVLFIAIMLQYYKKN